MKLFNDIKGLPRYTQEALALCGDGRKALEEAARPYLAAGASIREVALILMHSVFEFECETFLEASSKGKTIKQMLTEN